MDAKLNACFSALEDEAAFFAAVLAQRADAEMAYAESLLRIAQRSDDFEAQFQRGGIAQPSLHLAWLDMKQDALRTADVHRKTAIEVRAQVVDVLTSFRDGKQRVLQRVKEELRTASSEYADYKASVQRYQKAYDRSCDQVRQIQQQQHEGSGESGSSGTPSLEIVSGVMTTHLRDNNPPPAHTTAVRVNDALKQSGQQITTLFNRLGGSQTPTTKSPPDTASLGGPSAISHVSKLVKAKKEAEAADSDYRKGVYHLQTLRLQKERVHRSAAASVLEYVGELAFSMKTALETYLDLLRWSSVSATAFVDHAMLAAAAIYPEQDTAQYSAKFPLEASIEPPVYYENAFVGRCKTLLFGVPLAVPPEAQHLVPRLVTLCTDGIEARLAQARNIEGVYRVSAVHRNIQRLVLECEKDASVFEFEPETDVHSITGLLKLFLRQLPTPLCGISMQERVDMTKALLSGSPTAESDLKTNLVKRFRRLAPVHQATLKAMIVHIQKVLEYEAQTKMGMSNMSLMLTPVMFDGERDAPMELHGEKDAVLEFIVTNFQELFDGLPAQETRQRSGSQPSTPGIAYTQQFDTEEEFPLRVRSPSNHVEAFKAAPIESAPLKKVFSMKRRPSASRPGPPTESTTPTVRSLSPALDTLSLNPRASEELDPLAIYEAFTNQANKEARPANALPAGAAKSS